MARQTPEGLVKEKIKAILRKNSCYFYMAPGGAYGVAGTPDFLCCYRGEFFAIEAKAAGGKCTELQLAQQSRIRKAQGATFVIFPDNLHTLEEFFDRRRPDAS